MEPFAIKNAAFLTSVGVGGAYPEPMPCEIAVVGRSNVGKSSLINRITGNGKLAKTSATPGKTRLINYFLFNKAFYFVDLPGYGFAKASKAEQKSWGELIESYLGTGRVKHIFLLLDIRHGPSGEDRMMFQYILYYGIPFTLIATKSDKLPKSQRKNAASAAAKELGAPPYAIVFSGETGEGRDEVIRKIGGIFSDYGTVFREDATSLLTE